MAERLDRLPINAAIPTTSVGRDTLQSITQVPGSFEKSPEVDFVIPNSADEMVDRLLSMPLLKRIQHWTDLNVDMFRAGLRHEEFAATRKNALPGSRKEKGPITMVFNGGLMGWQGWESLASLSPVARKLFGGTYRVTFEYVESEGVNVRPVWSASGLQTGNYGEDSAKLDKVIHEAQYDSDLVLLVGHSYGGMLGHDYAARHSDKAKNILIFSGGSPYFPQNTNFWAGMSFFVMNGTRYFHRIQETARFMASKEAQGLKFYNLVANNDPIVDGPHAPGQVKFTDTGHIGIFFDRGNLDDIIAEGKQELVRRKNRANFDRMMATIRPLVPAA